MYKLKQNLFNEITEENPPNLEEWTQWLQETLRILNTYEQRMNLSMTHDRQSRRQKYKESFKGKLPTHLQKQTHQHSISHTKN